MGAFTLFHKAACQNVKFLRGFFVPVNKDVNLSCIYIFSLYCGDVMKNKQQTTTILTAIAYLIDRQGLSPAEIQEIVIKTATELEQ